MVPEKILEQINRNRQRSIEELSDFLRIPSVSTDPAHASDIRRAAHWLLDKLGGLGLETELYETERHPVVFAQRVFDSGVPTLHSLFYL